MSEVIDIEMHLKSIDLIETIKEINSISSQDKTKAIIFIRKHLDEYLKCEYLTVRVPNVKKILIIKRKLCFLPHMMNVILFILKTSRKSVIITLQCLE